MSIERQFSQAAPSGDTVLTIGTFDGVHRGHQRLFQRVREEAQARGLQSAAITFRNHPRTVVSPGARVEYLTPWPQRKSLIKAQGIEHLVALEFTKELSLLKAREFVALLVDHLRMKALVVGPDFALGHRREGDIDTLKALGREMDFQVWMVEPEVVNEGQPIRSRTLRQLIAAGDVGLAETMLGRPFSLGGVVTKGDQRGKGLGFPTANITPEPDLLVPGDGIYATWAIVGGRRHQSATSIGVRPTFGPGSRSVEAYIFDFDSDIYGETLTLEFAYRLREEQAFSSVESLVEQMGRDVAQARSVLTGGSG
jgi:riboflavin kinase/FMN adenylyltransferase